MLSSIDKVSAGTIKLNETEITSMKEKQLAEFRKRHLGFIFQDYNLLDTLTVKENILLPLSITKMSKKEADLRFAETAEELGIYDLRHKYPSEISGGQNSGRLPQELLFTSRALFLLMSRPERSIQRLPRIY